MRSTHLIILQKNHILIILTKLTTDDVEVLGDDLKVREICEFHNPEFMRGWQEGVLASRLNYFLADINL